MSKVYVVIGEDRHTDDEIRVCRTEAGARVAATEFREQYGDRYEWDEEEIRGWVYYAHTDDDGPSVRIQKVELWP